MLFLDGIIILKIIINELVYAFFISQQLVRCSNDRDCYIIGYMIGDIGYMIGDTPSFPL